MPTSAGAPRRRPPDAAPRSRAAVLVVALLAACLVALAPNQAHADDQLLFRGSPQYLLVAVGW